MIYSYQGLTPPAGLRGLIRRGEAAGVIFFGSNIASTAQIARVISQLDQANASPDNPLRALQLLLLMMMTDQEGGQVRRLPGPPLLSEKRIGASANPAAQAAGAGTGTGQTLASAGMNVNLAPRTRCGPHMTGGGLLRGTHGRTRGNGHDCAGHRSDPGLG